MRDDSVSVWLRRRRFLDRAVAVATGLLVAPVVALLAALIRRQDGGRGVIRLARVGRDGKVFGLWKLRSMRAATPDGVAVGAAVVLGSDNRVTPLGRHLRRWRVDELPQLLNVIRGEMALFGPRPETPEYVNTGDPRWQRVLAALPGIAGPTQLLVAEWEASMPEGTHDDTYRDTILPVKVAVDTWYVEHATPWLDLVVLWSLVQRFVLHRRVTSVHRRLAAELELPPFLVETTGSAA